VQLTWTLSPTWYTLSPPDIRGPFCGIAATDIHRNKLTQNLSSTLQMKGR
jgi:hypothetical protein